MLRLVIGVLSVVLLSSCAAKSVKSTEHAPDRKPLYTLHIADNTEERRFDLELVSQDTATFCIALEQWPRRTNGEVYGGGQTANLRLASGAIVPAASAQYSVSCPGGCGYFNIEPGKSLKGFIPYSVFGDAEDVARTKEKSLIFGVHPHFDCR